MAERGVAPAVEKLLIVGIVTLFVAGSTTVVLGAVVPDLREATGGELADRILGQAANRLEAAVTGGPGALDRRLGLTLPSSIAGSSYDLVLEGRRLHLDHPDPAIGGTALLAVPDRLTVTTSRIDAGSGGAVVVRGVVGDRVVVLVEADA